MTKKDYIALAKEWKIAVQACKTPIELAIAFNMATSFCYVAKTDNTNFDKPRFLEACGL